MSTLIQKEPVAGGDDFIPMSVPMQKLEVPEIPGYHLHWMRGTPDRLEQARRAKYEFVDPSEIRMNPTSLAGDASQSANTDMGSRVSVVAGGEISNGQAVRLYLMKVKDEYWRKSQDVLTDRSEKTAAALRTGLIGAESDAPADRGARYTKGKVPDLFKLKRRP